MEKVPIIRHSNKRKKTVFTALTLTDKECKYNTRVKLYPDGEGGWYVVQKMVSEKHLFNPDKCETVKGSKAPKFFTYSDLSLMYDNTQDNKNRAVTRAKNTVYDLIRCNPDMQYFCTLTFDGKQIDRANYNEVCKKFSQWCSNRVKRNGFKYVAVIERHHKSNGLHFHMLCNEPAGLTDSGTVKCKDKKKPIRVSTANKYNIPLDDRQTVYNISDWHYGYSTAIQIQDDDRLVKCSNYICKYLTKDFEKIGGRYYYSGGELLRPKYEYCNTDFNNSEPTYDFEVCGIKYKVTIYEDDN